MNKNTNIENSYFLADWLEGKLTDEALKKMVSPLDYQEYLKLRTSLNLLNELNKPMDSTLLSIKKKISQKPKRKLLSLYTKFALGIAASFLLFLGLYSKFSKQEIIYNTTIDEQQTIALLDGSEVILNGKSTLKYNKKTWKNNRKLFLDGEAYFKVTKGQKFTVSTKNGTVSVLGTQFNVDSRNDYFKVFCFEGKVKVVTKNKKEHILTPNKGISVYDDTEKEITSNKTKPSWLSGKKVFENTPLKIVIAELENQYSLKIDKNGVNDKVLFTGAFDTKNVNLALATVFKPLGIKYQIKGNRIKLSDLQH